MKKMLWLFVLFVGTPAALATETQWQPASQALTHLTATLAQARAKIKFTPAFSAEQRPDSLFVAFPEKIPAPGHKAFAKLIILEPHERYALEAALTPDCALVKTCLLGSLTLQRGENPTIYHDRDNQEVTTPVVLHHGIHGYYTRGFSLADFWPARLEWRFHQVLYTLSWQDLDDQKAFVEMANSVIDQLN